jgi:hypothetical protein
MNLDEEWQKLCDACHEAQDALWDAMAPVLKAQSDVAHGGSQNASDTAYDALEAARERYNAADKKMTEFIDQYRRRTT